MHEVAQSDIEDCTIVSIAKIDQGVSEAEASDFVVFSQNPKVAGHNAATPQASTSFRF